MSPRRRVRPEPYAHALQVLRPIARSLFANRLARERSYTLREYQLVAAAKAATATAAGRNCALELPTGTGKTVIACLAAVLRKHLAPRSRVLLVVPSRTLVVQHFDVALWVAGKICVDRLTDEQQGNPAAIRSTLLRAGLIISTPGLLANALSRRVVEEVVLATFDFVIADEFDQFIVVDELERGSVARYAQHWDRLRQILPEQARYFVKSATLGAHTQPQSRSRRASHRARLLTAELDPIRIEIPEKEYHAVVPLQRIRVVQAADENVNELLEAIANLKGQAHLGLENSLGAVDYDDVERQAPRLCERPVGEKITLRIPGGGSLTRRLTGTARRAFCKIAWCLMIPQHLLEDLTRDLECYLGACEIKTRENNRLYIQEALLLKDEREDNRFHFAAGAKARRLLSILSRRHCERAVVFVRTLELLNGLRPMVATLGRPLVQLTGVMEDAERRAALKAFRSSSNALLLMTRTTGGRGLDLPFAGFAVFYSPKTDPQTMWQEMSRIRSTISIPKDTYVLCYNPGEVDKVTVTASELRAQGRHVELIIGA